MWPKEGIQTRDQETWGKLILTGPGFFYGIVVMTDGANGVSVSVYDNTEASGKKLIPTWPVTSSVGDRAQVFYSKVPIGFNNGLFIDTFSYGDFTYQVFFQQA